jgi:translation initiation factor 2 subunit 1
LACINLPSGYIDLSKRRVSPEDIVKCEERYMKSKAVASIIRHVASKIPSLGDETQENPDASAAAAEDNAQELKKTKRAQRKEALERGETILEEGVERDGENEEERCRQLYEQIGWPLGKIYGHPYDAFKLSLT